MSGDSDYLMARVYTDFDNLMLHIKTEIADKREYIRLLEKQNEWQQEEIENLKREIKELKK